MPIKLKTADPIARARNILRLAGFEVLEERLINDATQFRLSSGNVNVFTSGAVVAQGKLAVMVTRAFEAAIASGVEANTKPRMMATVTSRPQQAVATAVVTQSVQTDGEVSSRRHPDWSDAPWNGECPFDTDPPR